jgi:DNA-directed RNA polymerase specialized sigma24 family protein
VQVTLSGLVADDDPGAQVDTIALHQALEKLAAENTRMAQVVEYRFFGGLSVAEVAEILDVHVSTVADDWAFARAWLHRELTRA